MMHEESEIIIESCHSRTLPIANVKGSNQQPETLFYLTIRAPIHSAFSRDSRQRRARHLSIML